MRRFVALPLLLILALCGTPLPAGAAPEEQSLVDMNIRFLEEKKVSTRWGRDPFLLPIPDRNGSPSALAAGEAQAPLSLSAIIYREGQGAAIINDRILRKGDQVEGMEVQEVLSDRVLLREGSRVIELKVRQFLAK